MKKLIRKVPWFLFAIAIMAMMTVVQTQAQGATITKGKQVAIQETVETLTANTVPALEIAMIKSVHDPGQIGVAITVPTTRQVQGTQATDNSAIKTSEYMYNPAATRAAADPVIREGMKGIQAPLAPDLVARLASGIHTVTMLQLGSVISLS